MAEPKLTATAWDKALEKKILEAWTAEKLYAFDKKAAAKKGKLFVIDTPPPYPSGRPWHIGAVAHYSQIDMIARSARMRGLNVYFPIGIDRNGLPVELYTERKFGVHIQDVTREKFIELCRTALDDLEAEMIGIMKSMGMSCDFGDYYRTDSKEYRTLTQASFIELWKRGLIYEDSRPNNYCHDCYTTIADAEVVYDERPTQLVQMKFKVKETGEDIVIASTRPELLAACQVVMANPDDARYKKAIGAHAVIPLYNREVPIVSHPSVDPNFGTGLVMMCSYGDYTDVRIFRELGLAEVIVINKEGRMTREAGAYTGMKIAEARKRIMEDLEKEGLIVKKEQILHRTPICDRSKTPIEIIPMKEFYLKQLPSVGDVRKIAKALKFYPDHHRQILLDWIDSITIDWPISRRRIYGTEIPLWYCSECSRPVLAESGTYVQPWRESPPVKSCPACGTTRGFIGEDRTFDTWMDSSISPLFISWWKRDATFFKHAYPNAIRPQGKEIIRTWLYYTLLRCFQLTKKAPFQAAWIMGWGVDEKGEKMSKSKGNVIDPIPILEKYGADAFRFWNAAETSLGSDFRCSEKRIEGAAKFITKLWNVARFISAFERPEKKPKLTALDDWILAELERLKKECAAGYAQYNFFVPANKVRVFVWDVFAPYYIELAKSRAYGQSTMGQKFSAEESAAARWTLHEVLSNVLLLIAPVIPFMADYVWRELYGQTSIHAEKFPKAVKVSTELKTEELLETNSKIWKYKKDAGQSLKAEVPEIDLPASLKPIEKDMVETHRIKKITWAPKPSKSAKAA